ncbi:alpha-L-fucosidase, partial [Maribacter dokdonensis]|uniref:alpha-L-fucosidase n=2 Tax=Maribacter TaxID=252356 RepID=UPI003297AA36
MKKLTKILTAFVLVASMNTGCAQTKKVVQLSDDERMEWWRDAKFGMFIHWGAYSIIGGERG